MIILFGFFLLALLLITAIGIVRERDLFAAVMLSGIFSLQIAGIFFLFDAADVALTEAAVGAGVAVVLMLSALSLTTSREKPAERLNLFAILTAVLATAIIVYATFDLPSLGDPDAPVHQRVAPWYLSETPRLVDIPNVVTAILVSFRAYDTLGELFVIFTAGIGVSFLLGGGAARAVPTPVPPPHRRGLRHHLVPRIVGRFLVPFIVLFGLYIQFHGEYGPGGGFQAGALISAGLILYSLIAGESESLQAIPHRLLRLLMVAGALLFLGVGVAGVLLGGNFLDYSALLTNAVAGQHLGIRLVEVGVGATVTGVLMTLFHAFASRESAR